jgi:hypothetical protein
MRVRRVLRQVGLCLFCSGAFLGLSGAAGAATFTVLNTNDGGADSLRAAITAANGAAGPHTINFNIPGAGPHVIGVLSALPVLVQTMTIDGYSQPGSSPNTNGFTQGLDTVLRIALDGSASGNADGLTLRAPDIAIRGLAIYGFSAHIRVERPRAVIAGNFIGTNIAGTADADGAIGGTGVYVGGPAVNGGDGSVIGGAAEADRNLISGFVFAISIQDHEAAIRYNLVGTDFSGTVAITNETGIHCEADNEVIEVDRNLVSGSINGGGIVTAGSQATPGFCRVTGNYVGVNVDATLPLGNYTGIGVGSGPHEIGGPVGNVVGGNEDAGIVIGGNGARLINNAIGTRMDGGTDLGNGGAGILVRVSADVQIGGASELETNVIGFNGGPAILVTAPSTRITVGHSTFLENGGLPIDLNEDGVTLNDPGDIDGGANQGQNHPEIVSTDVEGGQTTVAMALDSALAGTYQIRLYSSATCDPSGFGVGGVTLVTEDVVADANGDASFEVVVAGDLAGESVSATATDPNGNTSELSRCVLVLGPPIAEVPSLGSLGMLVLAAFLAVVGLAKISN